MCWDLILFMSCIQMIPRLVKFMSSYQMELNEITLCF
jgi:hypothetical protein